MINALIRIWNNLDNMFDPSPYGGGRTSLSSILVTTFAIIIELSFIAIVVLLLVF